MFDLASVERVVQNAPDRRGGEKASRGYTIFAYAEPMHIPGSDALGVQPTGQLSECGCALGVAEEQFFDRLGFLLDQMHSAGMLWFAG